MATRIYYPIFKAFTSAASLGANYKLWTYKAGTSTLLTTYTDKDGSSAHTNPIILNSLGEKEIFITEAAKFTLMDTDDNIQDGWPVDNIDPTVVTAEEVSFVPSGSVSGVTVQTALTEVISDMASVADVTWTNVSADTNVVAGVGYLVDTLTGTAAITLTFPAAPAIGNKIYVADAGGSFNSYNCIIGRNSLKILGLSENLTLDVNKMSVGFIYSGTTYGWIVV